MVFYKQLNNVFLSKFVNINSFDFDLLLSIYKPKISKLEIPAMQNSQDD